ncbi:MAG: hypothetical protein ACYDCK_02755 [Thermoplasmatota archaeon]
MNAKFILTALAAGLLVAAPLALAAPTNDAASAHASAGKHSGFSHALAHVPSWVADRLDAILALVTSHFHAHGHGSTA